MPGRAGYPEDEPRPLAEFSHAELEQLMFNPDSLTPEGRAQLSRELERRVEENPDLMLPPEMHYDAAGDDESHPMHGLAQIDYTNYDPDWQDKLTGEPMDLAWRLLKFQTTLPQFDPTLSEETGYVGVPPVQQYHSATLPDAMKFMTGAQDPHQRMWTEEDPERARLWARGMTQGGPGGAVLGVRGPSPRGERTSPDWSNQPPTEMDALTIPGAELSPQDIVMQRLPLPPPARSMRPRYSDEEIADEQARKKAALQYYLKEIVYNDNISDEEKDAALENISARFDFNEKISDDPSFRYNPTTNAWELEG
tara:strand:- start:13219 stop:14145 length:927 start_codon:yes stop_codon:yes gene_type:complete